MAETNDFKSLYDRHVKTCAAEQTSTENDDKQEPTEAAPCLPGNFKDGGVDEVI